MARPYSDDLRRKLLEAYDHGKGSLVELAERFGVSLGWAWKISSARKRTGWIERSSYRPGPKRRIDEQVLAGLLRDHADADRKSVVEGKSVDLGGRRSIK